LEGLHEKTYLIQGDRELKSNKLFLDLPPFKSSLRILNILLKKRWLRKLESKL